jgi:hypothetical protein
MNPHRKSKKLRSEGNKDLKEQVILVKEAEEELAEVAKA